MTRKLKDDVITTNLNKGERKDKPIKKALVIPTIKAKGNKPLALRQPRYTLSQVKELTPRGLSVEEYLPE